jgi:hypothetical protein
MPSERSTGGAGVDPGGRQAPAGVIATRLKASVPIAAVQTALAVLLLSAWTDGRAAAQPLTVSRVGDTVRVHAPGFGFIKGEVLARLKDGRSVRVDLEVAVLPRPGATPVAQNRQTFVLSYDLWEERFAVTQAGAPPRSISHLTPAAAEAWCIEQLAIADSALGSLGRDLPFWARLQYRILDGDVATTPDENAGLTLRWLIDTLSRRRWADTSAHAIEAGPLRLRE